MLEIQTLRSKNFGLVDKPIGLTLRLSAKGRDRTMRPQNRQSGKRRPR
jgi:hypothetical protein